MKKKQRKNSKNELNESAEVTEKQLTGILNTKERNNEAKRKRASLWFSPAGVGGGDVALREGLALQSSPHTEKDPVLPRAWKGANGSPGAQAGTRVTRRGILALGRACYRSERGAEQRTSGGLGCRPVPRCLSDTAGSVLDCGGEKKCWKRRGRESGLSAWLPRSFPSPLELFRDSLRKVTVDEPHWPRRWDTWWRLFLLGGEGLHLPLWRGENTVLWTRREADASTFDGQANAWLAGAPCGIRFLARNPCLRPWKTGGRLSKPGGCSLGLANSRFFQRLVFSETEMCLARNPFLIFKPLSIFYVNLIHMFLSYFYLAHQIELGATMMKGTMLISKKILEPFFLRTKSHFLPNC